MLEYKYGSYGAQGYGGFLTEDGVLADFPLVGSAVEKSSDKCGVFSKNQFCPNSHFHEGKHIPDVILGQKTIDGVIPKGKVVVFVRAFRCTDPLCPDCCFHWARLQVGRAMRRFEFFGKGAFNVLDGFELRHLTVSVPRYLWNLSYCDMKSESLRVAWAVGVDGGVAIYHPKRYNRVLRCWYFSPHFHVLGFVRDGFLDGRLVARVNDVTGFVIKNLARRKSVYWTLMYQLSHAGVPSGRSPAVVWFGGCNSRMARGCDSKKGENKLVCPVCETPLVRAMRSAEGSKVVFPFRAFEDCYVLDDWVNWVRAPDFPKRKKKYSMEEDDLFDAYDKAG